VLVKAPLPPGNLFIYSKWEGSLISMELTIFPCCDHLIIFSFRVFPFFASLEIAVPIRDFLSVTVYYFCARFLRLLIMSDYGEGPTRAGTAHPPVPSPPGVWPLGLTSPNPLPSQTPRPPNSLTRAQSATLVSRFTRQILSIPAVQNSDGQPVAILDPTPVSTCFLLGLPGGLSGANLGWLFLPRGVEGGG